MVRTHPPRRETFTAVSAGDDGILVDPAWADAPEENLRDDAELLALAKADRQRFVHLYRRYLDPVHRFCHGLLGDRAAAEDATSATFLKAFERLDTCRDGAGFKPWLFAIALNVVNDDYRSRRPSMPLDAATWIADGRATPEEVAVAGDERLRIWTLLRQLKPDERDLIALRLEGFNDKEIAAILRRNHGAIRNKQSKTLGRLKTLLGMAGLAAGEEMRRDER